MTRIDYIMDKLYEIDKELGGNSKKKEKGNQDEFIQIKDQMQKTLMELRNKMELKNKGKGTRTTDVIRAEMEYKQKMEQAEKLLDRMNVVLRKQKNQKQHQKDYEMKSKLYENIRTQLREMSLMDETTVINFNTHETSMDTLTDRKQKLLEGGNKGLKEPLQKQTQEQKQQEDEALNRWRRKSMEQNERFEGILNGLEEWNRQAKLMGEKLDIQEEKTKVLDKEVDRTNKQLETTNKKLKVIIDKYRSPSKFCLDIILVLLIIGLGVTMYYYFN